MLTLYLSHSFKVLSQIAQNLFRYTPTEFFSIYSKKTLHAVQFFNKLSKNPVCMWLGKVWSNFWANYERTLNEWLRYSVSTFWVSYERTHWVLSKKYLQETSKSFFRSSSQFAPWANWNQSGRFFLNALSIYPLGKMWVNLGQIMKKLGRYFQSISHQVNWRVFSDWFLNLPTG